MALKSQARTMCQLAVRLDECSKRAMIQPWVGARSGTPQGRIRSPDRNWDPMLHGDSDSALEILRSTRLAFESAGLRVCH
jgi:hypothetical protein